MKRKHINFYSLVVYSILLNAGASFMWPLITVYMHNYLHKSLTLAGFVMLAMSISMIIGNYLGGKLFDGWEPFKTAILGSSISLISVFLLIFFNGWPIFSVLLVLVAFGDGICMTILNSYAASSSSRSSRTIFNLLYIGVNLGIVIGTLLVGFLLGFGVSIVYSAATIFYLILLAITLLYLNVDIRQIRQPKQKGGVHKEPVSHIKLITGICFVVLTVYSAYALWESVISVRMTSLNISFEKYSLLWTINGFMIVLFQPLVNRLGVYIRMNLQIYIGVSIFAVSFIFLIFARTYEAFLIAMIITTFGDMIAFPGLPAWIDTIVSPQARGYYQGIYNVFMSLGRAVGPVMGGVIIDVVSYESLFLTSGFLIIISLIVLIMIGIHNRSAKRIPKTD